MFWIALEMGSSKMGLIIKSFQPVKKLIAFKSHRVVKSGNTGFTRCLKDAVSTFGTHFSPPITIGTKLNLNTTNKPDAA